MSAAQLIMAVVMLIFLGLMLTIMGPLMNTLTEQTLAMNGGSLNSTQSSVALNAVKQMTGLMPVLILIGVLLAVFSGITTGLPSREDYSVSEYSSPSTEDRLRSAAQTITQTKQNQEVKKKEDSRRQLLELDAGALAPAEVQKAKTEPNTKPTEKSAKSAPEVPQKSRWESLE